ncbi:MAG: cation-efflux pump [Anaerolineae bacterium]
MRNYRAVRWVLIYTMGLNLLVTAVKLLAGFVTGSLSLVADGLDSLFDSVSNVVGLVGIAVAARPPDAGHPYGHRKFETLSAAGITILLFMTTVELVRSAVERLRHSVQPEINLWTVLAIVLSIAVHLYVSWYERRKGKELKSEFLVADAMHTRADVLVSVAVGVGMIVVRLGFPVVDAVLALVIAGLIAKIGFDIIRDSSKILADAAAIDEAVVKDIVSRVPGVVTFHRMRSRGQEDDIHLDLHVHVRPGTPVEEAHAIAHEVERRLQAGVQGLRDVVVHIEPERGAVEDVDERLRTVARTLPGVSVHHVQAHEIEGRLYVTLHLEVGGSSSLEQAHDLASQLETLLHQSMPQVASVDIHIEPAKQAEGLARAIASHEPTYQQVRHALDQATQQVEGLEGLHDVVVSHAGGRLLVSAHWECDGNLSVEEAHALSGRVEQCVQAQLPSLGRIIVHVEPRPS